MNRYPVIDGVVGSVDVYGTAATRRGAMRVANRYFADPVVDAEFIDGPVTLRDGTRLLGGAWIALTASGAGLE